MTDTGVPLDELVPEMPPANWWWEWAEHGDVVVWRHSGDTIAFRQEITDLCGHRGRASDLPLGAVVLLLAACRDTWDAARARDELGLLIDALGGRADDREMADQAVAALGVVAALPRDQRTDPRARRVLAELALVSVGLQRLPLGEPIFVDKWVSPAARAEVASLARRLPIVLLRRELGPFRGGLRTFDAELLRLRTATGLDALPRPADAAELEPPPATALSAPSRDWLDDPAIRGVAVLARHVATVVSLPRALDAPEDLPEGGLADITNRGPLDRLLLSELTHDESTLAARLALGEALYHRRELSAPPPPRSRQVLLDCGVRMWGVPRVYATAVALALRGQTGPGSTAGFHRASGGGLAAVDLDSRAGLVEQLAALETEPHPGAALGAFAAAVAGATAADAVLVTCDESLADPEFKRQLAASPFDMLYVVSVARDGRLKLLARSRRGTRLVREATLDVEHLLAEPLPEGGPAVARRPLFDPATHDLPAIFGVDPFPLRIAVNVHSARSWQVEGWGLLTYSKDGRLLHWDDPDLGPVEFAAGLPAGRLLACDPGVAAGRVLAVVGRFVAGGLHALHVDCRNRRAETVPLEFGRQPVGAVTIHAGRILVRSRLLLHEFDPLSGRVSTECPLRRGGHQIGRCIRFQGAAGVTVLAAGPARAETLPPCWPAQLAPRAVFLDQTTGSIGVVGRDGDVSCDAVQTASAPARMPGTPIELRGVSRDGARVAIRYCPLHDARLRRILQPPSEVRYPFQRFEGDPRWHRCPTLTRIINVASGVWFEPEWEDSGEINSRLHPDVFGRRKVFPCQKRFQGVRILSSGEPTLAVDATGRTDRRRLSWAIRLENHALVWRHQDAPDGAGRVFEPLPQMEHRGNLHRATFADGTVVWLDGRGLIHVRSSVTALPEVTLVLSSAPAGGSRRGTPVAGWLSDGRVFGPRYHHGREPADDRAVYTEVLRPLFRALRT